MKKSLILVTVIGLLVTFSSVAFAQSSKKKSKTPPAKASGAKAKTAGLSQGTFSPDVVQKKTNLSGGDDPDGNTQRSSKASKSKVKTNGYAEYEEIADQTPKKPANNGVKANRSTKKTNSKPTTNIVTNWDDMEKVKGTTKSDAENAKTSNVFVLDTGAEVKSKSTQNNNSDGENIAAKTGKVRLENTSWKVMSILDEDYKPKNQLADENLATLGNIRLLAGGKIEGGGTWKLVGSKLTIKTIKLNNIKIITLTLKDNTADGKGLFSRQSIYGPFRLVKI